jgi:hypothetical protein
VHAPLPDRTLRLVRPPSNALPLLGFSFRALFGSLSTHHVLAVFGCLLLEVRTNFDIFKFENAVAHVIRISQPNQPLSGTATEFRSCNDVARKQGLSQLTRPVSETAALETRVALFSRHIALLTPAAEALLLLLFPFEWQGAYIPVVPDVMGDDLFDAPVPYLLGAHRSFLDRVRAGELARPDGVVLVDLDHDEVRRV